MPAPIFSHFYPNVERSHLLVEMSPLTCVAALACFHCAVGAKTLQQGFLFAKPSAHEPNSIEETRAETAENPVVPSTSEQPAPAFQAQPAPQAVPVSYFDLSLSEMISPTAWRTGRTLMAVVFGIFLVICGICRPDTDGLSKSSADKLFKALQPTPSGCVRGMELMHPGSDLSLACAFER